MKLALVSTGSVSDSFPPLGGGIEVLEYQLLSELKKRGHTVQLFSSSSSLPNSVPIGFPLLKNQRFHQFVSALNCFLKRKNLGAEVVHAHHPLTAQAFLKEKPLVYTEHNWYNLPGVKLHRTPFTGIFDLAQKRVYREANAVIALSSEMKEFLEKNPGVKGRVELIPNYTDSKEFSPKKKNPRKILFVGRLAREKGLEFLFRALKDLKGYELEIIGSGPEEEKLKQQARKLDISASFLGHVPHNKLSRHYSDAGIFVLPSFFEVMPVVLIEAMSSGCAAVAFDAFGVKDLIEDKKNGFVVWRGNVPELREKISLLLDKPLMQKKLGLKAREKVLKEFDAPVIAAKLENIYSELIN